MEMTKNQSGAKAAGSYIKGLREACQITQTELAEQLLLENGAIVARVEEGEALLTAKALPLWALALGAPKEEFVETIGQAYAPVPFDKLWNKAA